MYRPGQYFAGGILALPLVVTLVVSAVALAENATVPIWVPFILLLWIPCLVLAWRGMLNVRTDGLGIAAGRPWTQWQEIPWSLVERVDQSRATVRVHGSTGTTITFAPLLLRDGGRLKRQLLLRLPTHVLSPQLAREAQTLLAAGVFNTGGGGLTGTLHARCRPRWRALTSAVVVGMLGIGAACVLALPLQAAVPLAAVCCAGAASSTVVLVWLFQELSVSEKGVTTVSPLTHRTRGLAWEDVELVEHSAGQTVLRLRGAQRITCVGPSLLSPSQRDLLRAFIYEYCVYRQVPVLRRPWLWLR
jgi:hypothetical protein